MLHHIISYVLEEADKKSTINQYKIWMCQIHEISCIFGQVEFSYQNMNIKYLKIVKLLIFKLFFN